ncbi:hypothetical protein M080_6836, partial [Bacteroides fragilis str. 3397 T10]
MPLVFETPPLGGRIAMIFPVNSIAIILNSAAKL